MDTPSSMLLPAPDQLSHNLFMLFRTDGIHQVKNSVNQAENRRNQRYKPDAEYCDIQITMMRNIMGTFVKK